VIQPGLTCKARGPGYKIEITRKTFWGKPQRQSLYIIIIIIIIIIIMSNDENKQ